MAGDVSKRVRYFDHQFLRAAEFQDEQAYHIDRRRRHGRSLHSPGVADLRDPALHSLEVSQVGTTDKVAVHAGWAIDAQGREIVLADPGMESTVTRPGGGDVDLYISYPDPEPTSDPSDDPGTVGTPTRILEQPVLTRVPGDASAPPADAILLATVTVDSAGSITSIADRRTAAGVEASNIVDGSITTAKIADGAVTEPKLGDGAASTRVVADGAVTQPKLADGSVSTAKIADRAVTEPKLADGAASTRAVADGAVTEPKLADGAASTRVVADGAVTQPKVAPGSVSITQLRVGAPVDGTDTIGANGSTVVGGFLPAGFHLVNIFLPELPPPDLGVGQISVQEEFVAFSLFGGRIAFRRWRVTNLTANQVTIGFRIYRLEEA
jgi:hypothetical protein